MLSRRTYGIMVFGNESGRYIRETMSYALRAVDALLAFDDQSTDGTADIVKSFGTAQVVYVRRKDDTPSFLQHEGRFRQAAWDAMEAYLRPKHKEEWILSIDADEVLCSGTDCQPCEIKVVVDRATRMPKCNSILLPIHECFGYNDVGWPMVRKDGFWGRISGTRLFQYRDGGKFKDAPMASGSEPLYVERPFAAPAGPLSILHFGYSHPDDQQDKYARYSGRTGHSDAHVESILAPPTLEPWSGLIPPQVFRGG